MSTSMPAGPDSPPTSSAKSPLQRIPLALRMLVYSVSFLLAVLVAVPWVFYQIDVYVPAVHVEIGRFRIVGAVLFAVCLVLYLGASFVLTCRGKGAYVEFDPPTELVVTGPYRYVRNPVAATLVGAMLGLAIALSSVGVFLMFCLFAGLVHLQVVKVEEPLLRQRYGEAYDDYCRNVPRWIPRLACSKPQSPATAAAPRDGEPADPADVE